MEKYIPNVQNVVKYKSPSDHLPLEVTIRVTLAKPKEKESTCSYEWKGVQKPEESEKDKFQEKFSNAFLQFSSRWYRR